MLDPIININIKKRIKSAFEETGHVCDHWIDEKLYKKLHAMDKKDKGNRTREYEKECFEPVCIAYPPNEKGEKWKFKVSCKSLDWNRCLKCDYDNTEAADKLLQEYSFIFNLN